MFSEISNNKAICMTSTRRFSSRNLCVMRADKIRIRGTEITRIEEKEIKRGGGNNKDNHLLPRYDESESSSRKQGHNENRGFS